MDFFGFIHLGTPTGVFLTVLWRSDFIWLRYFGSKKWLFVCFFLFLCIDFFILIILGHHQKHTLTISWRSDLICLRYLGSKKCLIICLLVCLFADLFFHFSHLGTPTGMYPENFMKIWLDLAEILSDLKIDLCDGGKGRGGGGIILCNGLIIFRHLRIQYILIGWDS